MENQIAEALTSGVAAPTIGAALVLVAWLASKLKHGVPLLEQLKAAGESAIPAVVPAIAVVGAAMMAGTSWLVAIGSGLTVLLTLTNFRAPLPGRGGK